MYLDAWVSRKINHESKNNRPLNRQILDSYTENKKMELLAFLYEKSPFYQNHLRGIMPLSSKNWEEIPFTLASDLIDKGEEMLCVHPGEISRIVSQTTSGTTGAFKRVFFTPEDQELTVDYFHHGMKIMVSKADNVLILLPHKSPGSLGFLLQEGLSRLGAQGFFMDSINDFFKVEEFSAIVGPPTLIVNLAKTHPKILPHTVLMTADFVTNGDRRIIKEIWGSKVFEHYGMTEMGLGCAMSCRDTEENIPVGYHVRENDLYIEIIDSASGKILPQGDWGEIVVTTLTRKGMPLLRYRTGDNGRWLKDPCLCGSLLKRLDRVAKRIESKNIIT